MADVEFDNDIDIDIIILILIIMLKLMLRVVSDSVPPLLIESTRGRLPIRKRARKTFFSPRAPLVLPYRFENNQYNQMFSRKRKNVIRYRVVGTLKVGKRLSLGPLILFLGREFPFPVK